MTPVDVDGLDALIADARCMPAAMLPRPREHRVVDLTAAEITIPDATVLQLDGYSDYGS